MHAIPRLKPELLAIVTKVATHLSVQRARATDSEGSCKYRGKNGTMCAIGVLIPDDLYMPSAEMGVASLINGNYGSPVWVVEHLLALAPTTPKDTLKHLFTELQRYHDSQSEYQSLVDGAPITITNDELRTQILEGIDKRLARDPCQEWFA